MERRVAAVAGVDQRRGDAEQVRREPERDLAHRPLRSEAGKRKVREQNQPADDVGRETVESEVDEAEAEGHAREGSPAPALQVVLDRCELVCPAGFASPFSPAPGASRYFTSRRRSICWATRKWERCPSLDRVVIWTESDDRRRTAPASRTLFSPYFIRPPEQLFVGGRRSSRPARGQSRGWRGGLEF